MAKDKSALSDLFSPPHEELQGIGAILCGYSADTEFIDHALTRFTRATNASRLARGSVDWTLLLNPPHEVISIANAPGVIQLRPKAEEDRAVKFKC